MGGPGHVRHTVGRARSSANSGNSQILVRRGRPGGKFSSSRGLHCGSRPETDTHRDRAGEVYCMTTNVRVPAKAPTGDDRRTVTAADDVSLLAVINVALR